MESNMLTSEKLITSINTVKNVSTGFFPENIPPKSIFIKILQKKSANFAPMFMSNADNFVTPSGIPTIVAATIPSRIDPSFFAWSTPITTRPTNATNAPHTRRHVSVFTSPLCKVYHADQRGRIAYDKSRILQTDDRDKQTDSR